MLHVILCPDNKEELMEVLPVLNYLPFLDVRTTTLVSEDFEGLGGRIKTTQYSREDFPVVLLNALHSFENKTLILKNNPPELDLAGAFQDQEVMDLVADPFIAAVNLSKVADLDAPDPLFNVVYDTEALIEAAREFYPDDTKRPKVSSPNGMASVWAFYNIHV